MAVDDSPGYPQLEAGRLGGRSMGGIAGRKVSATRHTGRAWAN